MVFFRPFSTGGNFGLLAQGPTVRVFTVYGSLIFNLLLSSYFTSHSSLALFFQRRCHEVECGLYYVFYVGWRSALTVSESKREREKEN